MIPNKKQAEGLFKRKANPQSNLTIKDFFKRTKTVTHDPSNYEKNRMTSTVYGDNKHKIKKQKVIETAYKKKVVDYGPINYYGKQKKTKTITRK